MENFCRQKEAGKEIILAQSGLFQAGHLLLGKGVVSHADVCQPTASYDSSHPFSLVQRTLEKCVSQPISPLG